MLSTIVIQFLTISLAASAAVLPRETPEEAALKAYINRRTTAMQKIPSTAPAPGSFNTSTEYRPGQPPKSKVLPDPIYGVRDIDIPFGRLFHGDLNFFGKGELNNPDMDVDDWKTIGTENDSAQQSACGIPDNAFFDSKVAIHPYFLKYAGLDREFPQVIVL